MDIDAILIPEETPFYMSLAVGIYKGFPSGHSSLVGILCCEMLQKILTSLQSALE
jgi:hypothetical protein